MTALPNCSVSVDEFFFGVGSEVRFSDDQTGREVRMLLAAYGERVTDLAKQHAPIQEIRGAVKRINEVLKSGIDAELDKALDQDGDAAGRVHVVNGRQYAN